MKNVTYKKVVLLVLLVLVLISLSFVSENRKNEAISQNPVLIHELGHLYKISNQVFFRRCSSDGLDHFDLTNIDAKTFQYVNDFYVKDKNGIWSLGVTQACEYPTQITLNPVVDLTTFSVLATSSSMAKDKFSLIFDGQRLAFPSRDTTYLGFVYYKDKNQILKNAGYGNILLLRGVPADTKPVSSNYLVDNKNVYDASNVYSEKDNISIVMGADPSSFKELNNGYSLDKNNVYFKSQIVLSADPINFQKVSGQAEMDEHCGFSYWKDTHGVYLKGKLIQSANPYTFKVIQFQGRHCNGGQYSIDKDHVFYNDTLLNEVDISTFVYKGGLTIFDSRNIYVAGSKCVPIDTTIENKELGYSLQIPKGWNYTSEPQYGRDHIFDCINDKSFFISKGPVTIHQDYDELPIINQFVPNATIKGWKYEGGEGGPVRKYQITFPQKGTSFVITLWTPIEDFPILSSLISL